MGARVSQSGSAQETPNVPAARPLPVMALQVVTPDDSSHPQDWLEGRQRVITGPSAAVKTPHSCHCRSIKPL